VTKKFSVPKLSVPTDVPTEKVEPTPSPTEQQTTVEIAPTPPPTEHNATATQSSNESNANGATAATPSPSTTEGTPSPTKPSGSLRDSPPERAPLQPIRFHPGQPIHDAYANAGNPAQQMPSPPATSSGQGQQIKPEDSSEYTPADDLMKPLEHMMGGPLALVGKAARPWKVVLVADPSLCLTLARLRGRTLELSQCVSGNQEQQFSFAGPAGQVELVANPGTCLGVLDDGTSLGANVCVASRSQNQQQFFAFGHDSGSVVSALRPDECLQAAAERSRIGSKVSLHPCTEGEPRQKFSPHPVNSTAALPDVRRSGSLMRTE